MGASAAPSSWIRSFSRRAATPFCCRPGKGAFFCVFPYCSRKQARRLSPPWCLRDSDTDSKAADRRQRSGPQSGHPLLLPPRQGGAFCVSPNCSRKQARRLYPPPPSGAGIPVPKRQTAANDPPAGEIVDGGLPRGVHPPGDWGGLVAGGLPRQALTPPPRVKARSPGRRSPPCTGRTGPVWRPPEHGGRRW